MNTTTTTSTVLDPIEADVRASRPTQEPVAPAASTARPTSACTHSIAQRLSSRLALVTMVILAVLFYCAWYAVSSQISERNAEELQFRSMVIADIIELEAKAGGVNAVQARVAADAAMRANTRLELWHADGRVFYTDPPGGTRPMSDDMRRTHAFTIVAPSLDGGELKAKYTIGFAREEDMKRRWAAILSVVTLAAGLLVALATRWRVKVGLRPLNELASQTRAIAPDRLDQRLHLPDPASELTPWIDQFNALMGRLDQAYAQLEGFNADVAHELRTPLTTLMGQTELALSRERSVEVLRDTLASNLEELQRLSALVNDMLFLSQADRGARARRGEPVSLAALMHHVVEFHDAAIEDKRLTVQVDGDACVGVDEPLIKRAASNLLGNATRFADAGSVIYMQLQHDTVAQRVHVMVQNQGPGIDPGDLPRIFDRFFRADISRCCDDGEQHYGLGLAIIAAIARMHGGEPAAGSSDGVTRIGFSLAVEGPAPVLAAEPAPRMLRWPRSRAGPKPPQPSR